MGPSLMNANTKSHVPVIGRTEKRVVVQVELD